MRAVVFKAPREVAVEDVPDARAEQDDDVVVWVTSSALCGTDLHMYDGRTGASPGVVLGHEGLGIVEFTGPADVVLTGGVRPTIRCRRCRRHHW